MAARYQISDGKLLLTLQPEPDGWYVVTSPIDPAMITQARTIPEAFEMARDASAALSDSRSDSERWRRGRKKGSAKVLARRPAGSGT